MILLPRTRDARKLKGYSGKDLQVKLGKLLDAYYAGKGSVAFEKKLQLWKAAKQQLRREAFDKCAYCEAPTATVAHGDVEHFRPKSEYWWLAYSYDNYTFSCQICNQSYKGNRFPVSGGKLPRPRVPKAVPRDKTKLAKLAASLCPDPVTVTDDDIRLALGKEDADLPHPYVIDPEKIFAWEAIAATKEVHIKAADSSPKAKRALTAAEEVLGLNRTELLNLRWLEYEKLEFIALTVQEGQISAALKDRALHQLNAFVQPQEPFSGMKRFFLRQWGLLAA